MSTKEQYEKLIELTKAAQEAVQAAYRYARDNQLYFSVPPIVYDEDDSDNPEWESSWDDSGCSYDYEF